MLCTSTPKGPVTDVNGIVVRLFAGSGTTIGAGTVPVKLRSGSTVTVASPTVFAVLAISTNDWAAFAPPPSPAATTQFSDVAVLPAELWPS